MPSEAGKFHALFTERPCVLVTHTNADVDSLAACIALSLAYPGVRILGPGSMDRAATAVAEHFRPELLDDVPPGATLVAVDASSPQMADCGDAERITAVLDHHRDSGAWDVPIRYIDESRASTCEMVLEILEAGGKPMTREMGDALLLGIISDTSSFKHAGPGTLERTARIIRISGANIRFARELLEGTYQNDMSKRIARLKSAQRLKYVSQGDIIIASSNVSTFEALAAQSLVLLGADIAFVGSQRKDEYRISGRMSRLALERGLHTGKLLEKAASDLGGESGGHDGAGGMNGTGDVEHALNVCMDIAVEHARLANRDE